jgi:hypothetical protein
VRVEVESDTPLWFGPGRPVRAASAIAVFGDGWLIAQDDATHAAWLRPGGITAVRVIDPVDGHETFSSAEGTKHLKPDFEAAVALDDGSVLLLGSGSTPARMRASLITPAGHHTTFDLTPAYHRVAAALGITPAHLNLEGAARTGTRVRWFQRGNAAAGIPSASVDMDLAALLPTATESGPQPTSPQGSAQPTPPQGNADPTPPQGSAQPTPPQGNADRTTSQGSAQPTFPPGNVQVRPPQGRAERGVGVGGARVYDLGVVRGVGLAITDAVALPDGRVLVSAAAEDTPNAIDDGPVVGAAVALLGDDRVLGVAAVPGGPYKIEGLAVRAAGPGEALLIAVVDADDPVAASRRLDLRVSW